MQIDFTPVRTDAALTHVVDGDVLTLNGEAFDFSEVPEGAVLPREAVACSWLASDVTRRQGEICLTLIRPHGPEADAAERFPDGGEMS